MTMMPLATPDDIFDPGHYAPVRLPHAEAADLPPWCYTSQAFFDREAERVFRRTWQCVGRTENAAGTGDYFTRTVARTPIIVVRGRDSVLRAFANTCGHRGALLLEDSGNCRAIQCPYHSWIYALDGALTGAPDMEETRGFKRADHGLVPVRIETAAGFVFVNLDDDAIPLAEHLGDLGEMFAQYNLEDMVAVRVREWDVECNWKLSCQVFMEEYHAKEVHGGSLYLRPLTMHEYDAVKGNYATQFGHHEGSRALIKGHGHKPFPPIPTLTGQARAGTRWCLVYPAFNFAVTIDAMWYVECYPLGPALTRYRMGACFPRSSVERDDFEAVAPGYYERWSAAIAEDNAIMTRQQRGLTSPFARAGRLCHKEPILSHLNNWLLDRTIGNG